MPPMILCILHLIVLDLLINIAEHTTYYIRSSLFASNIGLKHVSKRTSIKSVIMTKNCITVSDPCSFILDISERFKYSPLKRRSYFQETQLYEV